ncbi:MAG: 1-(5-phosphoribosyl)-5-[(5-phosphoribosylamino)methylideneamino]imidazole-4-carboxamide isomerase [Clostridia bacterium]|nr:1-(5-phosphoribosyl)-5-[(5-phosphoribosylamino)methylideneamino]imidazole-4-carboxamide isomerase [Clostridia bacterium]
MILLPAIDLSDGRAVRLLRGDYNQMTIYNNDPVAVANDFAEAGAKWMHLVDLDGAKSGETPNYETVLRIKRSCGLSCEIGGGIRNMETVERYLAAGLDRVILGTAALADEAFLCKAVERYGERIAVGVDLKDGYVAVKGWTERSDTDAHTFFEKLQGIGVKTVICTDISRDGAMKGTNRALYRELSRRYSVRLIASGGVSSMEDVRALAGMGLYGAIIGKAYYTGAIDLAAAIKETT